MHSNTLKQTATYVCAYLTNTCAKIHCYGCNTLQHTATHRSICARISDEHLSEHPWGCNTQQHTVTHFDCNTQQHTATNCTIRVPVSDKYLRADPLLRLQRTATHHNTLQHTRAHIRYIPEPGPTDAACQGWALVGYAP